jgi:hypothetical protein
MTSLVHCLGVSLKISPQKINLSAYCWIVYHIEMATFSRLFYEIWLSIKRDIKDFVQNYEDFQMPKMLIYS